MTEQQKSSLKEVEPISTWSDEDAPRGGPTDTPATGRGDALDPIPGTPGAAPLVDDAGAGEPRTSPETEHELDRLRRE